MEWIVTTGRTVMEAVDAALDELGVDEEDIEYEVVEESKRGFLSRLGGGSTVRIRARVEPVSRGLIERFGLPVPVTARAEGDDDVMVDVDGQDLGLLIGPRASTVDAIQELVRTAVQRRIGGHGARIHVDVAGYRAQRQAALAEFARQAAQRALESGRDQVFEPMSPVDRKIVHDIVNEIDGVGTVSEGEEPRRRVVIKALADNSS